MIMGSTSHRAIGEHGVGLTDEDGVMREAQPYVVLREATAAEWLTQHRAHIAPREPDPGTVARALRAGAFFYEVSID